MSQQIRIRAAEVHDTVAIQELAPRLTEGTAAWLPAEGVRAAVTSWVVDSIARIDDRGSAFVAVRHETVVGFVSVTQRTHWAGHTEGYIGELIVRQDLEAQGIGRKLVSAAESWLRERGFDRVSIDTGAANHRALNAWRAFGYVEEQVTLSKSISHDSHAVRCIG